MYTWVWTPKSLRHVLELCASVAQNGNWQRKEMIARFLAIRVGLNTNIAIHLALGKVTPDTVMQLLFPEAA